MYDGVSVIVRCRTRFDILNRLGADYECDRQTDRQTDGRTDGQVAVSDSAL